VVAARQSAILELGLQVVGEELSLNPSARVLTRAHQIAISVPIERENAERAFNAAKSFAGLEMPVAPQPPSVKGLLGLRRSGLAILLDHTSNSARLHTDYLKLLLQCSKVLK
jgi:hypothetical protein